MAAFTGIGVVPTLVSATATGTTTIRLTFSEDMDAIGLLTPSNYVLTNDPSAIARTPTEVTLVSATIVDLTISGEMTEGTDYYTVTVNASLTDLAGNAIDPANKSDTFDGSGTPPTIANVAVDPSDLTTLSVIYDEPVKQISAGNGDDALNPSNYAVTGDTVVTVSSVATASTSSVVLTVSGMTAGSSYSLAISNIEDVSNNVIA